MSTINLTADQFEDTLLSDGIVLVDFWAEWCGPCKSFGPVFEASSEKHSDITFAKVDTEAEQQLSGGLGIQSIPTIMAFRDGVQVFSQPGALPEASLEDLIGQIEALDMAAIHKEIAEHQNNHDHEHGADCNH
jgi:thioredoxin